MIYGRVLFAGTLMLLGSCASVRTPATGVLYSDVYGPQGATANSAGNRVGEACAQSYLGLVATGDASIEAARRAGGITMITSVDEYASNIFVFYAKYCTIVRGR